MSVYSWDAMLSHVARRIGEAGETSVDVSEIVTPPKPELGDVAYGCFKLAKQKQTSPAEIAKALVAKIGGGDHTIESVSAAGPYLNVKVRTGDLIARVIKDVGHYTAHFGMSEQGAGKQLMLEYAQPNTHKEIHVGHLRNLVLGASLARILQLEGWKVTTASYHGDVGAHVAKCLWLFVRQHAGKASQPRPKKTKKGEKAPEPMSDAAWTDHVLQGLSEGMVNEMIDAIPKAQKTGAMLGSMYAEATKLLDENPEWKVQVSEVQQKIEAHDPAWTHLWAETRRWSVDEFGEIFQELGVTIDRQYFESEVVDKGQRIVDALLKKGVAKMSEGAVVVDFTEEKMGMFLIRKSDGTSLYATKDLALDGLKMEEFPKVARSLILVDNRQALYFKQLFRTLELMGSKTPHEFIGYEFVTLTSGAMSSREGNVVTWETFRDEVLSFARSETAKRHADWPQGRIEHTAWALAMGGIKFGMLKQDSDKIFTFDLERSLSFEGDTGPYVQYAATRLQSILRKAQWKAETGMQAGDPAALHHPAEKAVALHIAAYPSVCARAARELRPSLIAQWCVGMAHRVGDFYRDVNVLESEFGVKQARLQLVATASSVLSLGLNLLGIPVPDEM